MRGILDVNIPEDSSDEGLAFGEAWGLVASKVAIATFRSAPIWCFQARYVWALVATLSSFRGRVEHAAGRTGSPEGTSAERRAWDLPVLSAP